MADSYDRYENDHGGGFMMGLLTGTVLGAGLGMLLAPRAGSELRGQLGEQARNLANTASEQYRRATEQAGAFAERGRDLVNQARDTVTRGAEQAREAVSRGAEETRGFAGTTTGGSTFGGSTTGTTGPTGGTGSTGGGSDFGRS
jgi:gas vesicle protein